MGVFALLFVAAILNSRNGGGGKSELAGTWVAQSFLGSQSLDTTEHGTEYSLTFMDDGTFTGHMSTRVMMIMDARMKGTYERTGDEVILTGVSETYLDDGYQKGTNTLPFSLKLKVESDRLTQVGTPDMPVTMAFRREGTQPLSPPTKPELPASDPTAVSIFKELEKRYADLKSYSDEGTFVSDGTGFKSERGKFKTLHSRAGGFLFRTESIENGKTYQTDAVWGDGKTYRLYMGDIGGSEERPLGNGLSILGVRSGNAATMIPSLLEPVQMKGTELDRLEALTLLPDEAVDGRPCFVIEGAYGEFWSMRLWVDKESYLIRRVYDSFANETVNYAPRANPSIPADDFRFVPPN